MPQISYFFGIIIKMYFKDHNPPHFHAEYQGYKAEYNIVTLELLVGEMPRRPHALIIEWASIHRAELLDNWARTQTPESLNPIAPLD